MQGRLTKTKTLSYSDCSDDSADDCTDGYSDCEFDYSASDKTKSCRREVKNTCECSQGYQGNPCRSTIQLQDIIDCRNNCFELTSSELDLVTLGTGHASLNCDEVSRSGRSEQGCPFIITIEEVISKRFCSCIAFTKPDFTVL